MDGEGRVLGQPEQAPASWVRGAAAHSLNVHGEVRAVDRADVEVVLEEGSRTGVLVELLAYVPLGNGGSSWRSQQRGADIILAARTPGLALSSVGHDVVPAAGSRPENWTDALFGA